MRTDLVTALSWIAPADAGWIHDIEGPDDMPAHVKSMLNGVSLRPGQRWANDARHLPGHLCCRASRAPEPPRAGFAVSRQLRRGLNAGRQWTAPHDRR